MPRIIPIRDLKDTAEISRMCHEAPDEPILVTKNGYQDMVIVSPEFYEEMEKLRLTVIASCEIVIFSK